MSKGIVTKARVKAKASNGSGTAVAKADRSMASVRASAKGSERASPGVTTEVRAVLLLCFYPCLCV